MNLTDIGEFAIYTPEKDYNFKPSFKNIHKLGSGKEIVEKFAIVHGLYEQPIIEQMSDVTNINILATLTDHLLAVRKSETLPIAYEVMTACYLGDDISDLDNLIGFWVGEKARYKNGELIKQAKISRIDGAMTDDQIIIFAQGLLQHGVTGKANIRIPLRDKKDDQTTDHFDIFQYITGARVGLEISREEAENLSMTEFHYMLDAKFGHNKQGYTEEEHEQMRQEDLQIKENARKLIEENPDLDYLRPENATTGELAINEILREIKK